VLSPPATNWATSRVTVALTDGTLVVQLRDSTLEGLVPGERVAVELAHVPALARPALAR